MSKWETVELSEYGYQPFIDYRPEMWEKYGIRQDENYEQIRKDLSTKTITMEQQFEMLSGKWFGNPGSNNSKNRTLEKIKTLKERKIIFTREKDDFILSSDTQEIKSEYSNNSYKYFTQISFDISKEEIELIKKGAFTKVQLDFKRKSLVFDKTI